MLGTILRIAVLASGRGSNFQAIIDGIKEKEIDCEIAVLITDNPEAKAIERAKENNIHVEIVDPKLFKNREEMDKKIKQILDKNNVRLVVLAGYMKIIKSKELLDAYQGRIINIHPSLLPAFKSSIRAQQDAFNYGCMVSGLTIHLVTSDVDGGAIIYQEAVDISDCKTGDEAAAKILKCEHKAYRKVVASFAYGAYGVTGKRASFIYYPI
ncbi:MAG: phosphoribosylglycinamide formyltransferase [Candidatus Micrarchaeota archaeon]